MRSTTAGRLGVERALGALGLVLIALTTRAVGLETRSSLAARSVARLVFAAVAFTGWAVDRWSARAQSPVREQMERCLLPTSSAGRQFATRRTQIAGPAGHLPPPAQRRTQPTMTPVNEPIR